MIALKEGMKDGRMMRVQHLYKCLCGKLTFTLFCFAWFCIFFYLFSITMNFATDTVSIQYISLHSTSCIVKKKGQKYFQLRTIRQVRRLHGFKGRGRLILRSRLNEAKDFSKSLSKNRPPISC